LRTFPDKSFTTAPAVGVFGAVEAALKDSVGSTIGARPPVAAAAGVDIYSLQKNSFKRTRG
jgi:hypothetical protein